RARLSYAEVAAALADPQQPIAERAVLEALQALAQALRAQRGRDHLLMPDRPDYRLLLDDAGQIAAIDKQRKNAAQQVVEECMVAANRCAADYLKDEPALFVCHGGFRAERREAIAQLL